VAGHNKASWEQQAGQADAMRWRAWVIFYQQVVPLLAEAEEKYILADKARGARCPRVYGGYGNVMQIVEVNRADGLV
jgi:hypothetical protein